MNAGLLLAYYASQQAFADRVKVIDGFIGTEQLDPLAARLLRKTVAQSLGETLKDFDILCDLRRRDRGLRRPQGTPFKVPREETPRPDWWMLAMRAMRRSMGHPV